MRENCTSGSVRGEGGNILTYSASGARNLVARHHAVISAVCIRQQNLPVILEKIFWSVSTAIQGEVEDVVGMGIVAHIHPHPCVGGFALAEHGHDGVVGGYHMGSPQLFGHQLIERFDQIGHISTPD